MKTNPAQSPRYSSPWRPAHRERGSVLIVAMILAAIIGISLVSYLKLSNSSLNISQRNFYDNAAMNLAETGLERAMYCLNQNQVKNLSLTEAWPTADGWTTNTTTHIATCTFSGFNIGPNTTGTIKVYVSKYDLSGNPVMIVAKATVGMANAARSLSKYIEVTVGKRGLYSGIIAKNSVRGDSGLVVDSWISTDPVTGIYTPYSVGVRRANGPIGVVASANGALNLGDNPKVYGTTNTGGGTVAKTGSAVLTNVVGGTGWSTALQNSSFTYSFPTVTVPSPNVVNTISANITASVTFPRAGDVMASDGKYYYNFGAGFGINYGNQTMTIKQPVVFIMNNHSGTNAIYTSSSATFTYGTGGSDNGSFSLYTNGNINFDSGANWFANKAPVNTNIFGTNSTGQTFATRGGGNFYGSIIAENAAITFDSGTAIMGAISCKSIVLLGNVSFHYDEALAANPGGGYKVTKWKELQNSSERAVYDSALNF